MMLRKEAAVTEQPPPGATVKTGELCPQSGLWQVAGKPSFTAEMAKGHVVPPCGGKTVVWQFLGSGQAA